MLENSVYRGEWLYAKKSSDPIPVQVPAIVTKDVWEAVKAKLDARMRWRTRNRGTVDDYTFLLRGAAHCSDCGGPMYCTISRRKTIYHYYKCKLAHADAVYTPKCKSSLYHRADVIDVELWKKIKAIVTKPGALRKAFREYQSSLQSGDNPVRDKLEKKRRMISSTERELSQLVYLFTKDKITETQYDEMKTELDTQLARHTKDAIVLSEELEQSTELEEHMETVSAFVKTANQALKAAEKDDAAKRNFLLGLGVGAAMSQDRHHKYVDWFIFAPDAFSVRRINQLRFSG
jgi:hypothetical protein